MIIEKYVKAHIKKYLTEDGYTKREVIEFLNIHELEVMDIVEKIDDMIVIEIDELINECDITESNCED